MILKMSDSGEKSGFEFVTSCEYCSRKFSQYKALYAHMRRFHKDKPIYYRNKSRMLCSVCGKEQHKLKLYWEHIGLKHPEVQLSFEKKFFYAEEDFIRWKDETEAHTHTHFLAARAKHVMTDGRTVHQYQCDRSGFYRPFVNNRSRQFTGTKKIGKFCPAYIYSITTVVGDLMEIEVDYQSTHAGHTFDLRSLRLRSEKHERRLRSKGKGRWPKKSENLPPNSNEITENLTPSSNVETKNLSPRNNTKDVSKTVSDESKLFFTEVADILHKDPNLEVQQVTCTCEDYVMLETCMHTQAILKGINEVRSITTEANTGDDSSESIGSSCVDADFTTEADENPIENHSDKSLENEKASILEEFRSLVTKCQSSEQLTILKDIVIKGKKHLFSEEKSPHSLLNVNNSHLRPLGPYRLLGSIPVSALTASALPLTGKNNVVVLRGGLNTINSISR